MVKTLDELYAFVSVLDGDLRLSGHDRLAERLDSALNGSTSGEILEGLWFALQEVPQNYVGGDSVADALGFIQSALGPPTGDDR
jgi:hypothetical protein